MKQRKKRGRLSPAAENNLSDLFSGMTYAPAGTYGMGQAASLTVVRRSMLSSATNFNGSSHLVTVNFSYVMKNNETMTIRLLGFILVASILNACSSDSPDSSDKIDNKPYSITKAQFDEQVAGRMWVCSKQYVVDENNIERDEYIITGYDNLSMNAFSCEGNEFTRCYCHFYSGAYTEPRARFIYNFDFDEASGFVNLESPVDGYQMRFRIESVTDDSLIISKHHGLNWCYLESTSGEIIELDNENNYVRVYFRPATPEEIEKFNSWPLCPTEN